METQSTRPPWDNYFLDMVVAVSSRATCNRGRSGCVIIKDKRIICTGYVGSPPGLAHCDEADHMFKKVVDDDGTIRTHCVRTIHAEQNAICQAARHGISLEGSTLYCTMEPCRTCAMLIASVGVVRVVAAKRYHAAQETRDIFEKAGILLEVISQDVMKYENQ